MAFAAVFVVYVRRGLRTLAVACLAAAFSLGALAQPPPKKLDTGGRGASAHQQRAVTLGGLTIHQWRKSANTHADLYRDARRQNRRRWTPTLMHGINLAAATYGQSASSLRRVAFCESRWFLFARSPGGHLGPFQFHPGTWASTPYAGFSVFDPIAAPLAAGWMWRQGRKGEWACR